MEKLSDYEIGALKERLPDYLASYGINIKPNKNFKCISGTHEDNKPSMGYNQKGNYVHCFGCNASYDIFAACELLEGLEKGQGLKHIAARYGYRQYEPLNQTTKPPMRLKPPMPAPAPKPQEPQHPPKDFKDYVEYAHSQLDFYSYHNDRGISDEVAARFKLGYVDRGGIGTCLVLPMQRLDGTYTYQLRITEEQQGIRKHHKPKGGTDEIFNQQAVGATDKPLFITEAAFNALSVIEVGGEAIALNGLGNREQLLNLLSSKNKGKNPQSIVLSLDNDASGQKAQEEIRKQLEALKMPCYEINLCFGHKDPNEALIADRARFKRIVDAVKDEAAAKAIEYRQKTVERELNDFVNQLFTKRLPAISTGFKMVDEILRGGLREGLICIGGISSLGKTTFALQIMDNIARQGRDVLVFSLEMSSQELRAKSIARESLITSVSNTCSMQDALTTLEVLDKELREQLPPNNQDNFGAAYNIYRQYASRLFIHEAVGKFTVNDIKQAVERHIEATGKAPVVLVDYLQILQPAEAGLSDKAKVSYDVLMLKQLSRDKHTPVVLVSSFNRDSYAREASFSSFKESGEIEYSADVLIALQLTAVRTGQNADEALNETPRQIDVKFLKNRNGSLGIASFNATLSHNYFEEMDKEGLANIKRMVKQIRGK